MPNLFRVQDCLPQAVAVEAQLIAAVVLTGGKSPGSKKKACSTPWLAAAKMSIVWPFIRQTPPSDDREGLALFNFTRKLACYGPWISAKDFEVLAVAGFDDQVILEAVATTALGQMLCILADALQPAHDLERPPSTFVKFERTAEPGEWEQPAGPYLKSQLQLPSDFQPLSVLRDQLGFIPGLFRAQMLRPIWSLPKSVSSRADSAFRRLCSAASKRKKYC